MRSNTDFYPESVFMHVVFLTVLALIAFAANSVICRLALQPGFIDAASFTTLRVLSGSLVLLFFVFLRSDRKIDISFNWRSVASLNVYMVFFSFAYVLLDTGMGALILFGAVQLTMFTIALMEKERFANLTLLGFALAFGGMIYLVSPGVSAPEPSGVLFMILAGVGWGVYSVAGRKSINPLQSTYSNFVFCIPVVVLISLLFLNDINVTWYGVFLAILSGGLASGCGYVIWYAALKYLSSGRAAMVQLSVPAIAAFGGVLVLSEPITMRLVIGSIIILGGMALALSQKKQTA